MFMSECGEWGEGYGQQCLGPIHALISCLQVSRIGGERIMTCLACASLHVSGMRSVNRGSQSTPPIHVNEEQGWLEPELEWASSGRGET